MWLKFGVDKNNTLVAISDVPSGKTNLRCPYCGGLLVAKKGTIKEHHFAHSEETCYPVATKREVPTLPLYDNFHIQLSGKSLQLLKKLWQSFGENDWGIPFLPELPPLFKAGVIRKNPYRQPASYEFTDLGKIPMGMLDLVKFNQLQEPLLLKKLSEFERKAELAKVIQKLNLPERLVDLQLYRAQLRNILLARLYYLKIKADDITLLKIGITKRMMPERLVEIQHDLRSHYQNIEISVLGTWEHRGNVELYFKHKYKRFNYPIDSLTEYYKFPRRDDAKAALEDLRQMQPKELNSIERDIIANGNSSIAIALIPLRSVARVP
ncbi:GIY-YIG nuclease family protein [Phormidium sp. LEGE 05292]|uniref:GIY-YIG nuclease family protein n=1 Tax=[Phormidium] sp. LEGE 05292 TaxID=767427 RepID=UPI0018801A22|nr:GIY-YIG nuclease family protein [Phormidium sp. LEGE 05292]MBE9224043.1 GIY-YIG nuclease family protein [Phormidium sp. LEGE 05292]